MPLGKHEVAVAHDDSAHWLVCVGEVDVRKDATSPVAAAWLLTYANLSPLPTTSRVPELPVTDWIDWLSLTDGPPVTGTLYSSTAWSVS